MTYFLSIFGWNASVIPGAVFTWGKGSFGRLGHGDSRAVSEPKQIEGAFAAEKIVQIACGFAYTAAISEDGDLYTWGAGEVDYRIIP